MLTIIGISLLVGAITLGSILFVKGLWSITKLVCKYVLPVVALLCILVLLSWPGIIAFAIFFAIALYLRYHKPAIYPM